MARTKGSKNKPKQETPVEPAAAPEAEQPAVAEAAASPDPTPTPEPSSEPRAETIKVETAGNYQLFDLMTNDVYAHDKPTTCHPDNPFVKRELEKGRLKRVN